MKHPTEVLTTTNYTLFKPLTGNRTVNSAHLNRLIASMRKEYIPVPILVNSKNEVIDGQHRLAACKELALPVSYIRGNGYGLKEVQLLNSNSKNWNSTDLAESFAAAGNNNYKLFLEFRAKYGFTLRDCVSMLSGVHDYGGKDGGIHAAFKNGLWVVKSFKWACDSAEKIYSIEPYYAGFKRSSFIIAMLQLFNNPAYNHKHFMGKLEFNSQKMQHCANKDQYMKLIESIYNWKTQDKVRFF